MTLIEMLLVLALLVVIATLAIPIVQSAFQSSRLKIAGDEVRQALEHARYNAMRTGNTYEFRFEMGGRKHRTRPWQTASPQPTTGASSADQASPPVNDLEAGQRTGKLPEEIEFVEAQTTVVAAADGDTTSMAEASSWSVPILFYADGTTADANVTIRSDQGMFVRIELRGLTGVVQVGNVATFEELR